MPQQNGVAERMNRTISDKVTCTCMLYQARLNTTWYPFAVSMAVWTINRIQSVRGSIPREALYNADEDLDSLRPFRYRAIAKDRNSQKFGNKALKCLFIGYQATTKAFSLLNSTTQTTFLSRDVRFFEHGFLGLGSRDDDPDLDDIFALRNLSKIHLNDHVTTEADSDSTSDGDAGSVESTFHDAEALTLVLLGHLFEPLTLSLRQWMK